MAIIYTYPEINQVEGEDLLLISDTSLYKRPTRSVTIDNLAAYIGTVIGIGFWNLGTAPDSIFTTKMASVGQDANIASSKLNVYKTDDMTASVPHVATFNESLSNHSLNLWPSPGDNAADIYGSVSRGTFTGSGTVDQIIGSNPIGRHSGSGSVNFIQGTQAAASLTGSGSVKTIVASYAKTFIEGTGSNNIENAFGAWNVAELNGLNDVDNIYGTYSNVVLTNGEVNDDAIGHFIDFDQVGANTDINNAYYIHAKNDSLSVTGEKFFIKDETGIPSQFSNKLVLNAYGSGTFTGTATQRLAVDTNGNVIEIPIGSGPVDGSGTANYTARWIDTDTLGIGALYDNGTNVGIGTTSPQRELDVNGGVRVRGPLDLFQSNDNTFAGEDAGNWYNVLGNKNAAFGKNSQKVQVNGSANTSAGYDSMAAAILGNFNTAIGESAMSLNNGGSFNTAIGSGALKDQTAGQGNTAIGFDSLNNKEASNFNTAVGYKSLFNISTGFKNIGIGDDVGLALSTGARNILIGSNANVLNNNDNNSIVIGESAVGVGSNTTVIGNNSMSKAILYGNVGIGTTSPSQKLTVLGIGSFGTSTSQTLVDYDGLNAVGNTDYIRFKVDNSEKLRITSAGNVGIGTTSPSTNLEIVTSNPSNGINLTTNTGNLWGVLLNTNSNDFPVGKLALKFGSNETASITARSNEMRIGGSQMNITFYTSSSEKFRVDTNGNVGIGTTSPSTKLHVQGAASGYLFRVQGTSTLNVYDPGAAAEIGVGSGSGDKLKLFSNDSLNNGITIDTSGNVGIGTTSPSAKLHVVRTIDADGSLEDNLQLKVENTIEDRPSGIEFRSKRSASASDSAAIVYTTTTATTNTRQIHLIPEIGVSGDLSNSSLIAKAGGQVKVGNSTYAAQALEISGTSVRLDSGPGGDFTFEHPRNGNVFFQVNNQTTLTLDKNNGGKVGIGTTAPTTKLQVNGDVRIYDENELYFGGTGSVPNWEMTASGSDLIVNDTGTNVGSVLFNNDEGVALPRLTTTEINAISSPAQGLMAYNTTLNTICFYNGSSWQKVSHTSM